MFDRPTLCWQFIARYVAGLCAIAVGIAPALGQTVQTTLTTISTNGYATTDVNSFAVGINNLMTETVGGVTYQFSAFYNTSGEIIIGRRAPALRTWSTFDSGINDGASTGDDHDVIALAVDGNGKMHLSWGMHNVLLNYSVSNSSVMTSNLSSVSFTSKTASVSGTLGASTTDVVTYPQFYNIPGTGNLLFTYRDTNTGNNGGSGNGDQYFVTYNASTQTFTNTFGIWGQLTSFNAYLNRMAYTPTGNLVATWTWRDTPDWQTNANLMFAQSPDNGGNWYKQGLENSSTKYDLPIIQATKSTGSPTDTNANSVAQTVFTLPENTSYINQGSMALDNRNRPIVATYWAPGTAGTTNANNAVTTANNPNLQYMLMYYNGTSWATSQITHRTSDTFFDGPGNNNDGTGSGTYVRDLGRPLVMVDKLNRVLVVTRSEDTSMGSYSNASLGLNKNNIVVYYNDDLMSGGNTLNSADWKSIVLDSAQMGSYEPTYDSNLWLSSNMLDLFYEPTGLGSATASVKVLEWNEQHYFSGDMNSDLSLTVADVSTLMTALTNKSSFESSHGLTDDQFNFMADVNGDGLVNNADIQSLILKIAISSGSASLGATPVPEPAGCVLMAIGGLLIGWARRCNQRPNQHMSAAVRFGIILLLPTVAFAESRQAKFDDDHLEYRWKLAELKADLPADWSDFNYLTVELKSSTAQRFEFVLFTSDNGVRKVRLQPFQGAWIRAALPLTYFQRPDRQGFDLASLGNKSRAAYFINLTGSVGPLTKVESIGVAMKDPIGSPTIEIRTVKLDKQSPGDAVLEPKPLVDEFGQWIEGDWPGKAHSLEELKSAWSAEEKELKLGDFDYSQYGGYKSTQSKATGFFRVEKTDNRWWIIDPEGHNFFSTGVDVMVPWMGTRTEGRDGVFAALPPADLKPPSFRPNQTGMVSFYTWNLLRRFGPDWQPAWNDLTLRRMDAWGLNTIANWADPRLSAAKRKPYIVMLRGWGIDTGYLGLPDVYADEFAKKVDAAAAEQCTPHKDDPWLLGYFIANEPPWPGRETEIVSAILDGPAAPIQTEAKKFLADGDTPQRRREFVDSAIHRFIDTVCAAMKKYDPNHLNLGLRFGSRPSDAMLSPRRASTCSA